MRDVRPFVGAPSWGMALSPPSRSSMLPMAPIWPPAPLRSSPGRELIPTRMLWSPSSSDSIFLFSDGIGVAPPALRKTSSRYCDTCSGLTIRVRRMCTAPEFFCRNNA